MYQETKTASVRNYLAVFMVALAVSMILSPPSFAAQRATGADRDGRRAGNPAELTIEIARHLKPTSVIGLYAKDLDSGKEFRLGEDRQFDAASTMKVLFAAYLYKQAAAGEISLDQPLTLSGGDIQKYGTGSIQFDPAPHKYTYRELTRRMLHESDNTAAYVISNRVGLDTMQEYADRIGLKQTDVAKNTSTASDMAILMEKLYREQLVDHNSTQELLIMMQRTLFEDRIPALLPAQATVSHKTGDAFNGGQHDIGVVSSNGRRYVMSVFTTGVDKRDVASISKAVYGYYVPTK